MRQLLAHVFGARANPSRRDRQKPELTRVRPGVEALETRVVLSGGITLASRVLHIAGTAANDSATARLDNAGTPGPADDRVIVRLSHGGHTHSQAHLRRNVTRIVFSGGNGTDRFLDFTPLPSVALGGAGNDVLLGGQEDTLLGGAGNNALVRTSPSGQFRLVGGALGIRAGSVDNDPKERELILQDPNLRPDQSYGMDLDGDGDHDIIIVGTKGGATVSGTENVDNDPKEDEVIVHDGTLKPNQTYGIDLDGDGDNDVIVVGTKG